MPKTAENRRCDEIALKLREAKALLLPPEAKLSDVTQLINEYDLWHICDVDIKEIRSELIRVQNRIAGLVQMIEKESY